MKISSETEPSEESTGGEVVAWGAEEIAPSEEVIISDVVVDYDIGGMKGVSSLFNNSAIFINTIFVELCALGSNIDCLLCNKYTMLSAV